MGTISASVTDSATTIKVVRDSDVSDVTWLQVRAEIESASREVSSRLLVPLERFLARRSALSRIAKQAGVHIELDDELRRLVIGANSDSGRLRSVVSGGVEALGGPELATRLAGGRFSRDLRPFQERDLGHLLALSHGANFSVPGAGKTAVALATYEAERLANRVEQLLVIAPLSAFGSWQEESEESFSKTPTLHRFDGGEIPSSAEIVLVNYHRLGSRYSALAEWVTYRPTLVILDEAHRMKRGWGGQWGTACLNIAYLARRRDILTGTPAPQEPKDLVALIDYLWPGMARRILPPEALAAQSPHDAGARIAHAIRPLFVRTSKKELDLPTVSYRATIVPLHGLQRDIYEALRDRYAGELGVSLATRHDFLSMGRIVMYLLEAATNPKLLTAGSLHGSDPDVFRHPPLVIPEGSDLAELLARYNEFETAEKFKVLLSLVKANADKGRKTLVWSNFVRNLKLLAGMLAAYNPVMIHGSVAPIAPVGQPSRETAISQFRNDPDCLVLLANPAAMSEGISLHMECHDAIYLDRTFNAGQYLQSIDRIHRLGLPTGTETRITFLITEDTIDATVDRRVRSKAERLGEMLDDPNLATVALPNDEDYGPPIDDAADLEMLFHHLRGDGG